MAIILSTPDGYRDRAVAVLEHLRGRASWSALAARFGVDKSTMSRWRSGEVDAPAEALAKAAGIPVSLLLALPADPMGELRAALAAAPAPNPQEPA